MQPTYYPWLGYFNLIKQSDVFVVYTTTQLQKRSWQVRNKIKTSQGETFLSIPVKKTANRNDLMIKDAEILYDNKWNTKHLASIKHAYSKTLFSWYYWRKCHGKNTFFKFSKKAFFYR